MAKTKINNDMVSITVVKEHNGPNGAVNPGDNYVTDAGHAEVLIEAGYAELTNLENAKV